MSIIFGIRQAADQDVEQRQLLDLAHATDRYAPDGTFVHVIKQIGMGFQPYHTHRRSNFESQPFVDERGNMLTLDGRLDNHRELARLLDIRETDTPDSRIMLAAFERWGEDCFSHFIGDWSLTLWSHAERSLYLVRDHAGTRTLYFEQADGIVVWSTFLETFFNRKTFDLDKDFAACYLGCQPIRDLTPYKGVRAVPPAHYLKFHEDEVIRKAHWQWMVKDKIRYSTNTEYEEHFFSLFKQSVERRTGPGSPILAQLSGGMDSSSIVCVSDHIRKKRGVLTGDLLDTLSYYDDTEPDWNERSYFSIVETQRGKSGIHIETSFRNHTFEPPDLTEAQYYFPGADSATIKREHTLRNAIGERYFRVILSGVGGDELLGGRPDPLPELADLLACGDIGLLSRQALRWCLASRTPLIQMLFAVCKHMTGLYAPFLTGGNEMSAWITPELRRNCDEAQKVSMTQKTRIGQLPSHISDDLAWDAMIETLPHRYPEYTSRYEYRYPYLDRDLVDFLFNIPRDQLLEPTRRRSLMRRTLKEIVPGEVLARRRKALLTYGPLCALRQNRQGIEKLLSTSLMDKRGLIETRLFRKALDAALEGSDGRGYLPLLRGIAFELWLRHISERPDILAPIRGRHKMMPQGTGAAEIRTGHVAV